MNITVKGLFSVSFAVLAASIVTLTLLNLAEAHLPANRITHECKPPGGVALYRLPPQETFDYEQAFCKQYYHVEFKDSWDRSINNVTGYGILLSCLVFIPVSSVLIFRKLSIIKAKKKR